MDYIIANIRITLPDAFVEGHFARALAPFQAGESAAAAYPKLAGEPEHTDCQEPAGVPKHANNQKIADKTKFTGDLDCQTPPARKTASAQPSAPALVVRMGTIIPEQPDYVELSVFDFPDADADCRFGRDGAGYLFEMMPRSGQVPARFRKGYDTTEAITDLTAEHNPALFRFGIWMMFNLAAVPLGAAAVHSSVIACEGGAVLFLGESGTGKSTHTRLWREHIPGAVLLNDDSPIVCIGDRESAGNPSAGTQNATVCSATKSTVRTAEQDRKDSAIAHPQALVSGSPWSGKTPCYKNRCLPIRAIVRLSQAPHNRIRRLAPIEAIGALLPSCPPAFAHDDRLQDAVCATISAVLSRVPAYHLDCLPDTAAAQLAHDTIFGEVRQEADNAFRATK